MGNHFVIGEGILRWFRAILFSSSYFRYLLVGGLAFAADYITLLSLRYGVEVNTELAAAAGFGVGFVISFMLNRLWAFSGGKNRSSLAQLVEYSVLVAFNLLFTAYVLATLEDRVPVALSKIFVVAIITIWNYLIYKKIIFREHQPKDD